MAAPRDTELMLHGPVGPLEAILTEPATDVTPVAVAVVCHPNPLEGGTMHNKVAHTLARTLVSRGIPALRFNYRGVGASGGKFDGGDGGTEDALALAAFMRERFGDLPVWLAGFSFGSFVALRAATQRSCRGLVMIAPAVQRFDFDFEMPACPALVVQGDADDVVDPQATVDWVNRIEPGPQFVMLPDVGHFFHGHLVELREIVGEFIDHA